MTDTVIQGGRIPTPYEDLAAEILRDGVIKTDRTGTGTRSVFGRQIRYDLQQVFPLLTTKRVNFAWIAEELLWFMRADSNIRNLVEKGVHIWTEWPLKKYLKETGQDVEVDSLEWKAQLKLFEQRLVDDEAFAEQYGDLGPVYGVQWRSWPKPDGGHIDQIEDVINLIKNTPDSRRMVVTAWNPNEVPNVALPACHALFQFYVADGKLSCQLYQRSADMFLGVPFNIASYALLTHMIAKVTNLEVGEFVWTGGDCHIYANHVEQVRKQLDNEPFPYPTLVIHGDQETIDDFKFEDFEVVNYQHHKAISAPVAV